MRALAPLLLLACGPAAPPDLPDGDAFGRCAVHDPLRRPFFGDLHVHTALSLDANLQGTRLRPADAYRFARGEPVGLPPYDRDGRPGRTARIDRPLDFAAVTDHAEFLGTVHACTTPGADGYDSMTCALYRSSPDASFFGLNALLAADPQHASAPALCEEADCDALVASAWEETRLAAEAAYDREAGCAFTTFLGYEWSANPGARNLHRNVIFASSVATPAPIGFFDAPTPEALWDALSAGCRDADTGCRVLTIPHNPNLSSGLMFEPVAALTAEAAARRAAFEPLVEVFQHKGDSECQVGGLAGDEACAFEKLPYDDLAGANLDIEGEPQRLDFVRDALGEGLVAAERLGENPYRYGLVGSTDTHLALAGGVAEGAFRGHGGAGQSNRDALPEGLPDLVAFNPGGLAVLWAEENSRPALFAAMERREAYATSGPRIVLRTFAGADLPEDLCGREDLVAVGYRDGVPMGGALDARDGAPRVVVRAFMDPGTAAAPGSRLQRAQVVKAWVDAGGEARFAVHDVAGAEVGAVDPDTCAVDGAGFAELCAVWTDPDFDPARPALYYARVLEVPTCRWSRRQCAAAGVRCEQPDTVGPGLEGCCDPRFPAVVQERAWSSPIWVEPR